MMAHCSDVLIHLQLTYSALWSVHGRAFLDPKRGRSDCTRAGAHWTVRGVTYSKLRHDLNLPILYLSVISEVVRANTASATGNDGPITA